MTSTPPELEKQIALLQIRLEEAEATVQAIHNGEVDAVVINDPTGERVFTLTGAEQPYRLLVEAMQQGAATLGFDGTILYCNRSFSALMQKPQEQLIGSSVASLFEVPESRSLIDLLAESGETGRERELLIPRSDGSNTYVSISVGILQLQNVKAFFLVLRDLTEHRKHQALVETDRRKDEFLAMLAHELRNPLAPIASAISTLGISDVKQHPVVNEVCAIVHRQVNQLTRIVDDLLDVSRITRGVITLQKEPQDISKLVSDAVESIRPLIANRRHRLHTTFQSEALFINGDYARLSQVLANVLNNAAKYMDDGGDIWITVDKNDNEITISVRDSGIGISSDLLPRIFDMFTQAERSIDRSQGGLGIGLTVVDRIVSLHGGRIIALSDGPGKGSEFIIYLPSLVQPPMPALTVPSSVATPGARRILVVDDNRDAADSMSMLLKSAGQDAKVAYDGATALALVKTFQPHLVLLDLGLPGMDGYAVARHLRELSQGNNVVLAALTGYGDAEDRKRSQDAGFDYHYVKPVNFSTLTDVLATISEA